MEIVAFDTDDKADGSGKAGITWISKDLLNTKHSMNDTTTTEGAWEASGMRSYLKNTIKPLIPVVVRNAIVPVTKIQSTYVSGSWQTKNGQTTIDDVWIPSVHEVVVNQTDFESQGATYWTKFTNNLSRVKRLNGTAVYWWLRSVRDSRSYKYVNGISGNVSSDTYTGANLTFAIALGFCTN